MCRGVSTSANMQTRQVKRVEKTPKLPVGMLEAEGLGRWIEKVICSKPAGAAATVYDAQVIPNVPVNGYLMRWAEWCPDLLPIVAVYLQKWVAVGNDITGHNVHRVLLSAMVVASKWHIDTPIGMSTFCQVGGVCREEISRMEVAFLRDIEWECHVNRETYQSVAQSLALC
eukprot:TRINITY_DN2236_c1_g1_i3.p1 TRINITY_DN2236_c1_g1~~TRINITY_DN2236_c1_g1_i3.p1  ORF type:complete len:194 (+),score=33.10 TRINITY_DN2236_c1_g1_i3:70-582(+)